MSDDISSLHEMDHVRFVEHLIQAENEKLNRVSYTEISLPRFEHAISICQRLKPEPNTKVLDIGRSYLSIMLARCYLSVTTLGLPIGVHGYAHEHSDESSAHGPQDHIDFDLNESQFRAVPGDRKFGVIVFAEVLEHLYTAPEIVLHVLRDLLTEDGVIVCQTPNAAALRKRLRLLRGRHPYEKIRSNHSNPGHYREYTMSELIQIGDSAGLRTLEHSYGNYYSSSDMRPPLLSKSAIFQVMCRLNPEFCYGQTIVYANAK